MYQIILSVTLRWLIIWEPINYRDTLTVWVYYYGNNNIRPFSEKGKYEIRNTSFTLRKGSAFI